MNAASAPETLDDDASPSKNRRTSDAPGTGVPDTSNCSPTYFERVYRAILDLPYFESRGLRAGKVPNFMHGLSLNKVYPFSPFTAKIDVDSNKDDADVDAEDKDGGSNNPFKFAARKGEEFVDSIYEALPTDQQAIYMVDAGLAFNSPYPLLLRGQRGVDVILSFDFSRRDEDDGPLFNELKIAEKWARLNNVPFPPIDENVREREGVKQVYIFRDTSDPFCPIILHFPLINTNFKSFKAPGIPRNVDDPTEAKLGDFKLFEGPDAKAFSTFTFSYDELAFERLAGLSEYNTLCCLDTIKCAIEEAVELRSRHPRRISNQIHSGEVGAFAKKWHLSRQRSCELKKFIEEEEADEQTKDFHGEFQAAD